MKIAITNIRQQSKRVAGWPLGRAPKFLIYDLDTKTFEIIDNEQI